MIKEKIKALKKDTDNVEDYILPVWIGYNKAIDDVLKILKEHEADDETSSFRLLQIGVEIGRKGGYVAKTG